MEAQWAAIESQDGLRFSWNVWPSTRIEAAKCVLPLGALYTPLRPISEMPVVGYDPVRCKGCVAVLNPYARVDFVGKIWICPFCHTRNHFPAHYAGVSETALPAELFPSYTTLEYALPRAPAPPPAVLFVLDTCCDEGEVAAQRTAVQQVLSLLPERTRVGLITFGAHVHVHELGFGECPKTHVFRGSREASAIAVAEALGLARHQHPGAPRAGGGAAPGAGAAGGGAGAACARFLPHLGECEFALATSLDELQRDAFPPLPEQRPARCTGAACAVAACVLGACCGGVPARVVLLVGGPATEGPGAVASKDLGDPVRSHKDVAKEGAPLYGPACAFYATLASSLAAAGHALDVFACALDQVGLAEMRPAVDTTGGCCVLAESFGCDVFRASFSRLFAGHGSPPGAPPAAADAPLPLGLASGCVVEVVTSRDVRVEGCLGPVASHAKATPGVSDKVTGCGGTSAWRAACLGADTTLAFFFEAAAPGGRDGGGGKGGGAGEGAPGADQLYVQFVTTYADCGGCWRTRVTTATRRWCDGASTPELAMGFDQEAAAALVARLCVWKMGAEDEFDPTRWLDRGLIRLCARFGDYRKDEAASFALSPSFSLYPQFVFNLRRSSFVAAFNSSPDETAFVRTLLQRASTAAALTMMQPSLMSYSFGGAAEPVLLDVASILPDRVLLLDAYFSVVVFHGSQCAAWRKAGYAAQPEHAAFAQLLAAPRADAAAIVATRFPRPRTVDCDAGGSQARFLLARLNPSSTYASTSFAPGGGGDVALTDDVSLSVFMSHLTRLATSST